MTKNVVFDLMGGDWAPHSSLEAITTIIAEFPHLSFTVVGQSQYLSSINHPNVTCIEAPEVVAMDAEPMHAVRAGARSSMGKCIELLVQDPSSVMISAGNTAALMALAYMKLRHKEGKRRPAIMSHIEFQGHRTWILDLGANIASNEQDLYENAIYGAQALDVPQPIVRLLNIGSEDNKGTPLIQKAHAMLKASDLNYKGYIEGHGILNAEADLVVCNGFEGNAMTKLLESAVMHWRKDSNNAPKIAKSARFIGVLSPIYKCHGASKSADFTEAFKEVIDLHFAKDHV